MSLVSVKGLVYILYTSLNMSTTTVWVSKEIREYHQPLCTRHTDNSRSPAPDIAVPRQALCYLSRSNRGLKNRRLFLQHPLFLALVSPGNHKQQNTQPSKRIVPWINIAFLGISGLLIHYHLAPSGLVAMGSIIAKFTRVKISLWCVIIWVWFVTCVRCCKGSLFSLQQLLVCNNSYY